jgi:hypothetical protein
LVPLGRSLGVFMAKPHLVIYPIGDRDFDDEVRAAAAATVEPQDLERALSGRHPNVRVHNGVTESDGGPRWYVYREGRWNEPDLNS